MWILEILAYNLCIVFITELPLSFFFGARDKKQFITAMLVNVITNPPVVLCALSLAMFLPAFESPGLFLLEIAVFLAEGFMFAKFQTFGKKNPYLISLVLNLVSYVAGEIINILF